MSVRRTVIIGAAIVVLVFLVYSWFSPAEEVPSSREKRDIEQTNYEGSKTKREEALEQRLGKIESLLTKLLQEREQTATKPDDTDDNVELDKLLAEGSQKMDKLVKLAETEFKTWAEKQEDFLLKIDEEVKVIVEEMEKVKTNAAEKSKMDSKEEPPKQKPTEVNANSDDGDKRKKPESSTQDAQDEIDRIYDQLDQAKDKSEETRADEHTDDLEEIDVNADTRSTASASGELDDPDIAEIPDSSEQSVDADTIASDGDDLDAALCLEDEIEDLIIGRNITALCNHEVNSGCLYLNGRPSLYCNWKKARAENWFALPPTPATAPPPAADTPEAAANATLHTTAPPDEEVAAPRFVALASMVRSGNSWVRYLVEAASGIVTEAAYKREGKETKWGTAAKIRGHSGTARRSARPGENVVVKTHHADGRYPWSKVVRLLRFPMDIEPWMRFSKNLREKDPFTHFKAKFAQEWTDWHGKWNCWQGEQLIIRYEDLIKDTKCVLREILDFLEYNYTDADIERAVTLYPASRITEKEREARTLGWDVPSNYLDYATHHFAVVVKEFGYQPLMEEVNMWREEKGV